MAAFEYLILISIDFYDFRSPFSPKLLGLSNLSKGHARVEIPASFFFVKWQIAVKSLTRMGVANRSQVLSVNSYI